MFKIDFIKIKCPYCKATIQVDSYKDSSFCMNCGKQINLNSNNNNKHPKKNKIIFLMLFFMIALGAFLLFKNINNNNSSNNSIDNNTIIKTENPTISDDELFDELSKSFKIIVDVAIKAYDLQKDMINNPNYDISNYSSELIAASTEIINLYNEGELETKRILKKYSLTEEQNDSIISLQKFFINSRESLELSVLFYNTHNRSYYDDATSKSSRAKAYAKKINKYLNKYIEQYVSSNSDKEILSKSLFDI